MQFDEALYYQMRSMELQDFCIKYTCVLTSVLTKTIKTNYTSNDTFCNSNIRVAWMWQIRLTSALFKP